MVTIVINNLNELRQLQQKIRTLRAVLPTIQKAAVKDTSEETLDKIKAKMKQNNFSDKIINATFVGKIERVGNIFRTHFISNYEADTGFDVSNAREEGTNFPNPILPKKVGGVLRWFGAGGKPIFRKRSHPKGMERLLIIEKTIKQSESTAVEQVGDKIAELARKVLGV